MPPFTKRAFQLLQLLREAPHKDTIERLNTALHDRLSTPPYPVVYVSDVQHNVLRPLWERAGYRVERVLDPQIAGYRHAVGSLLWPRVVLVKD